MQELLINEGYLWVTQTALKASPYLPAYESWLQEGLHGQMHYLEDHLPAKKSPQEYFSDFRSVFSFGVSYTPHPAPQKTFSAAKIALYAQGLDYHYWLKEKLNQSVQLLKSKFPTEQFLAATDSIPLLERDLAAQGGAGWIGKNTCLLVRPSGSLFLIGEILTTLPAPATTSPLVPDFCGTCNRCLEACPTQAIVEPRKLDATKCISYWTIESREIPPEPLRTKMGDWLFGCDICQTVCPWNQKTLLSLTNSNHPENELSQDLREILTLSGKQIEKRIKGTPLQRSGPFGLRRNALIVAGNLKLVTLKAEIEKWTTDNKLGELAQWALRQWA